MKSTLAAKKTARIHQAFGASDYVNSADWSVIDWTIISIHFPINKNRAHGSVSSRFLEGYGLEFLAMEYDYVTWKPKIEFNETSSSM